MGYVSHAEIAHQRKSQVLLLIEIDSEDTKALSLVLNIWFQTGQLLRLVPMDLILQKLLRIPIQVYFLIIQNET
jgi:hypothetical protein